MAHDNETGINTTLAATPMVLANPILTMSEAGFLPDEPLGIFTKLEFGLVCGGAADRSLGRLTEVAAENVTAPALVFSTDVYAPSA